MPHIPNHRKAKRATLLTKRSQCLVNFSKTKFYKPSYRKLKSNNSSLARALSKEKQENQLLFSRNLALVAEVQDLGQACTKRDNVISDVLANAKEMLKMIVTMSGYVTNTISSCQEFVSSSNADLRSYASLGNRDSYRRLSAKSPARGVVKPMVSGHTITKPTINLSRINMPRINPSNLSTILEAPATPERNQEINEIRTPVTNVTLSRQIRYENRHARRMPERLIVNSPRINEEEERRLSKRSSRHSARMSGRYSRPKSGRLSGSHVPRFSLEHMENVGSPRVKLNDVSKLLQNSHTVNVRTLTENQAGSPANESQQTNDDASMEDNSTENIVIAETQMESGDNEDDDEATSNVANMTDESHQSVNNESRGSAGSRSRENSSRPQSTWEDPLEGPSWLFNIDQSAVSSKRRSSLKENSKTSVILNRLDSDDSCTSTENSLDASLRNGSGNAGQANEAEKSLANGQLDENLDDTGRIEDGSFVSALQMNVNNNRRQPVRNRRDDDAAINFAGFVNCRRSENVDDEDADDFTLMYFKQPNMNFDMNDLRLPVLEGPIVPPSSNNEPEPEITATIQRITQNVPMPSVSSNVDDSMFEQSIAVRLPSLAINDHNLEMTPVNNRLDVKRRKASRKENLSDLSNIEEASPLSTKASKQKKKARSKKDPSAAKVVLEKLEESYVKQTTPSPEEMHPRESNRSLRYTVPMRADNSSDSESSSTSTNSRAAANRPRRRKAPMNLQEPKLNKKLRRIE